MTGAEGGGDAVVRDACDGDLKAIRAIYAHHVLYGLASFEEEPPDLAEIARRRAALLALGLPYLVAERAGAVSGFAYAGPFRPRPAYRHTVENSIYVAPDAAGHGLGRLLLGALIERCSAGGFRQMVAVIGDSPKQRFRRAPRRPGIPPSRHSQIDRLQARPLGRYRPHATFLGRGRRDPSQRRTRVRRQPKKGAVTSTAQVLGGNVERCNTQKSPWRAILYVASQYVVVFR